MRLSTKILAFVVFLCFVWLLWLAYFVLYPQLLLMSKSDYSSHDQACREQGRGRLVTVNGSPVGCTGDPTAYTGSLH